MHGANQTISTSRIPAIDLLRGLALIAMTVFHFAYDLEFFGIMQAGFIQQPEWVYFARVIAGSFLFLTGFSLFLSHGKGIHWAGWARRFLKILSVALLITVATWFATPDVFIFFGILHMIALASLLGLVFLFSPWWLNLAVAAMVFALRAWGRTELLDAPLWWWTGLSQYTPSSSDYVPVFPWFGMVLIGMALARFMQGGNYLDRLARFEFNRGPTKILRFLGRNSLIYYLLHQPVMMAFLYIYVTYI